MRPAFIMLILVAIMSILVCNSGPAAKQPEPKGFIEDIVDLAIKRRDNRTIELPFIYDSLFSRIPDDSEETLILSELLKRKGFKVINWGRGNYPPRGPRIISLLFQKADCICELDKIYYSTVFDTLFEVAERIKCSDTSAHRK